MRHLFVWAGLAAAGATAVGGCGDARHHDADPPAPAVAHSRPPVIPRPVTLRDQLFSVERRWPGIAIADRLAVDEHGHGRIVRGGGGGGLRIERCTFTAGEMAGWRHDLRLIGMSRPTATSPDRFPATYLIDYRATQRIVQTGAMPKRYVPLTRRITGLLYRGGKGCHTIYAQRTH